MAVDTNKDVGELCNVMYVSYLDVNMGDVLHLTLRVSFRIYTCYSQCDMHFSR